MHIYIHSHTPSLSGVLSSWALLKIVVNSTNVSPCYRLTIIAEDPEGKLISKWGEIFYHIKWNYCKLFSAYADKIPISQIDWLFHYLPGDLGRHRVDNLLMFPVTSPDSNYVFGYKSAQSPCLSGKRVINIHSNKTDSLYIFQQLLQCLTKVFTPPIDFWTFCNFTNTKLMCVLLEILL